MLRVFDYEKMPVVEIVNDILVDSAKREASDIHFDPQEKLMKIRIRIDGELIDYAEVPNTIKKNLVTRLKIISGMNITESRLPQDGAIKATLQGIDLDLRVSCLPTNFGEKIVVRILDYSKALAGIEELGFSQTNYKKVLQMINVPNGIILVTGATGSGKSTTVYSILQRLNTEKTNIITVEDPIEMDIEGINQVQTNSEIGLDFATVLRSVLRQDPNIIMIGEMRDTETAKIGVRASITGHLVLSTIHTNNSLNTIERLLDMEVERYLLASALTGIISQKLARMLCPHCKKKRPATDYEKDLMSKVLGHSIEEVYTPVGCDVCGNGYHGRTAIQEVLVITQEIRDAISNNIRKAELRKLVYGGDVTTLLQDGLEKVESGATTFEEVLKLIELDDEQSAGEKLDLSSAIRDAKLQQHQKETEHDVPKDTKPLGISKIDDQNNESLTLNNSKIKTLDSLMSENETLDLDENDAKETETLDLDENDAKETETLDLDENDAKENETLDLDENDNKETETLDLDENDNKETETLDLDENDNKETETLEL